MNLLNALIAGKLGGSGADANAVHYDGNDGASLAQQTRARQNINAASSDAAPTPTSAQEGYYLKANEDGTASWTPLIHAVTVTGTSKTLEAEDGFLYNYGELTDLSITSIPAKGDFIVRFTSGSTATVLTVPNTLIMPDGFRVEANARYEINVSDGYALCAAWPAAS